MFVSKTIHNSLHGLTQTPVTSSSCVSNSYRVRKFGEVSSISVSDLLFKKNLPSVLFFSFFRSTIFSTPRRSSKRSDISEIELTEFFHVVRTCGRLLILSCDRRNSSKSIRYYDSMLTLPPYPFPASSTCVSICTKTKTKKPGKDTLLRFVA